MMQQPRGIALIDRGNPITRGLVCAATPSGNWAAAWGTDNVAGFNAVNGSAVTQRSYAGGSQPIRNDGSRYFLCENQYASVSAYHEEIPAGTNQTVFVRGGITSALADDAEVRSYGTHYGPGGNRAVGVGFQGNDTFCACVYDKQAVITGDFAPVAAQAYSLAARSYNDGRAGNTLSLWVDGKKQTQTTAYAWNYTAQYSSIAVSGTTANEMFGSVLLTWARALTDEEIISVSANPWQVFRQTSLWLPVQEYETTYTPIPTGLYVRRYPNLIISKTYLAGTYADIDEDPSSPDGNWLTFNPT